jgi:hypothetical protein
MWPPGRTSAYQPERSISLKNSETRTPAPIAVSDGVGYRHSRRRPKDA